MKILLVHRDKKPWAAHKRAVELKKRWVDDEVDIADAWNLPEPNYDAIHFLFSGGITKCKDYILENKDKAFTTLASYRTLNEQWDDLDDLKEIYSNCKGVVCQNKKLMSNLQMMIGGDFHYIPNGVDEKLFNKKFTVGFVAAKDSFHHKGYHLVEKACKELELDLLEAGGSKENMVEFYEKIDCLVIPSISEGCNNPTLEALAMNIPVISTDVGIASELDGVFIVKRNVESTIRALRKLSGRIQILKEFTWDKIAKQYRNLYVEK